MHVSHVLVESVDIEFCDGAKELIHFASAITILYKGNEQTPN
jgi:hypothetical protein